MIKYWLQCKWYRIKERVPVKIAWLLPRSIVYFAAIRVAAAATTGKWSNQIVPELTAMDALQRWDLSGH